MLFAIEQLVNLSPIVQIRYTLPSTFCTPIHNPSTFGIPNAKLCLPLNFIVLVSSSKEFDAVFHKEREERKVFVENSTTCY